MGQRLLLDLRIDVGECDATVTDRIEDTVDYAQVCDIVEPGRPARSYKTLERLCAAIADRLLEQYDAHAVWVKAAKPEPPIALPVDRGVGRGRGARPNDGGAAGYLGLGSNVGDRRGAPRATPWRRCRLTASSVLASSSVYETEPVGEVLDQRDFFNACLRDRDRARSRQLLDACKRSSASWAASPAASATARGRSTSTCCCWGRSSTLRAADAAPPGGDRAAVRARAAARARPGARRCPRRRAGRRARGARRGPGGPPRRRAAARSVGGPMLLVVDVGNTQTHFGVFARRRATGSPSTGGSRPCASRPATSSAAALANLLGAAGAVARRGRRLDRLVDGPAARRAVDADGRALPRAARCSSSARRSGPGCRSGWTTRTRSAPTGWSTRSPPTNTSKAPA